MTAKSHTRTWSLSSPEHTMQLGKSIGRALCGGLVIGLVGPLGAGKTMLVKGIASGNGLTDLSLVTSPTFTLVQEYPGQLQLFHLDVYRLRKPAEFMSLGVAEMIRTDSVVLVEWADRVAAELPDDTIWLELCITGDTHRELTVRGSSEQLSRFPEIV